VDSAETIKNIIKKQKQGIPEGIYSICSSHPYVIKASIKQARHDRSMVLIESTSIQVNQFGGYTRMRPEDYRVFVHSSAPLYILLEVKCLHQAGSTRWKRA